MNKIILQEHHNYLLSIFIFFLIITVSIISLISFIVLLRRKLSTRSEGQSAVFVHSGQQICVFLFGCFSYSIYIHFLLSHHINLGPDLFHPGVWACCFADRKP